MDTFGKPYEDEQRRIHQHDWAGRPGYGGGEMEKLFTEKPADHLVGAEFVIEYLPEDPVEPTKMHWLYPGEGEVTDEQDALAPVIAIDPDTV